MNLCIRLKLLFAGAKRAPHGPTAMSRHARTRASAGLCLAFVVLCSARAAVPSTADPLASRSVSCLLSAALRGLRRPIHTSDAVLRLLRWEEARRGRRQEAQCRRTTRRRCPCVSIQTIQAPRPRAPASRPQSPQSPQSRVVVLPSGSAPRRRQPASPAQDDALRGVCWVRPLRPRPTPTPEVASLSCSQRPVVLVAVGLSCWWLRIPLVCRVSCGRGPRAGAGPVESSAAGGLRSCRSSRLSCARRPVSGRPAPVVSPLAQAA